jgi:hypothetical protein
MKWVGYAGLASAALAISPLLFQNASGMAQVASKGAIEGCLTGIPIGWAGSVADFLSGTPLIGATLAAGGLGAVALAAGVAVGGMFLARYLDKRTPEGGFPWGRVVRWASLGTSMLFAAPMMLTGIAMGLKFIGLWSGTSLLTDWGSALGTTGMGSAQGMAASTASIGLLHGLTCALPLGLTGVFMGGHGTMGETHRVPPQLVTPERYEGRLQPLPRPLVVA